MAILLLLLAVSDVTGGATASTVTSTEARKQSLLAYVASRGDIKDKAEWDKVLRLTFGGSALKTDGSDAVSAAKSVISAGVFFGFDKKKVAQAAYDAHNDVLSWVPPPVAIDYQLLKLQGKKPKEDARLIAFNFPKYYSDDLAPEFVSWWSDKIAKGEVNPGMLPRVERQLKETRLLMRPLLRDKLFLVATLEAQGRKQERDALVHELDRDFKGVAVSDDANDATRSAYERYQTLSREMQIPESPSPAVAPPPPLIKVPEKNATTRLTTAVSGWLGTPYLFGGVDKRGIDCSGFVRAVYRESHQIELPRTSTLQATVGVPASEVKEGDILLFDILERGRISHVGVAISEAMFAHASTSRGVTRDKLNATWVKRAYRGARRVVSCEL